MDNNLENQKEILNDENTKNNKNNKKSKAIKIGVIIFAILVVLAVVIGFALIVTFKNKTNIDKSKDNLLASTEVEKSKYWIENNSLQAFDLSFMQLENSGNKVYSPLSIKYALKMLEEGAEGDAKSQISSVIGEYNSKKYTNSKNLSLANAIFVRDTFGDVKESYTSLLQEKYNAEVKKDSFKTANNINKWVNGKTIGLINNLLDDETVQNSNFILLNALAIDMEWEEKFIRYPGMGYNTHYSHEEFDWSGDSRIMKEKFEGIDEEISGMEIIASFNNYDIVTTLGEDNIKDIVREELKKYLKENDETIRDYWKYSEDGDEEGKYTNYTEEELIEDYLDEYIKEINENYKRADKTTAFSFYTDNNVKVFAKDLKKYDGTTLQYIGIMPVNEDLDTYVKNVQYTDVNNIINNLKELKTENFKDGVVTKITGFIPKFKLEYELELKEDLNKLGITKVFEQGNANLINISDNKDIYITSVKHKANIEFTQEGIKAAAATTIGGGGAGSWFDYKFEVPVEEIDLTFNKPYMFIIRDKDTGEVWFTGTVYSPLLYSEDETAKSIDYDE